MCIRDRLHAARDHLPKDIIQTLELLGKADNIPFNQLYTLAEDCADRYYTKVIKTLIQLLKRSFADWQTVLVNSARALKFLESYGNRQAKLWKVLSKYHTLPDHFHDLQTTFQTEFSLLKKATSKNIENLQEAVNLQQTYTTALQSRQHYSHQAGSVGKPASDSLHLSPSPNRFIPNRSTGVWLGYRWAFRPTINTTTCQHHTGRSNSCQQWIWRKPSNYRIPIGLNLSPYIMRILLNIYHNKTQNPSQNITKKIEAVSYTHLTLPTNREV